MRTEEILHQYGQTHLLDPAGMSEQAKSEYFSRLAEIDWSVLEALHKEAEKRGKIEPIAGLSLSDIAARRAEFEACGASEIRAGHVGAVLLAGGQGTRLGSDAPKGAFNIGVHRPLYIFEQLIKNLTEVTEKCGAFVPLFIMTSGKNDAATREFFEAHHNFGYPSAYIRFFTQNMAPCVDFAGKTLLEGEGLPALSPNGNGGWYASLKRAEADKDFPDIAWYNVFSVDNVLQRIADPVFVGATVLSGCMCGAKVVKKANPEEKVGVLCLEDGKPSVVEYYELSSEMANARQADGELCYRFGVILNYLFHAGKLAEIGKARMPVHVVKKKIPYMKEGVLVKPEKENGYKFESLILDMVRLAGSCLPFEVVREREFAPVKNREGVDSVETARALLERNGIMI